MEWGRWIKWPVVILQIAWGFFESGGLKSRKKGFYNLVLLIWGRNKGGIWGRRRRKRRTRDRIKRL